MLRISRTKSATGAPVLKLEGQLIGPWVAELRRICESVLGECGSLALDLSEVSFVDRRGLAYLSGLEGRSVAFLGCSALVSEQLGGRGEA